MFQKIKKIIHFFSPSVFGKHYEQYEIYISPIALFLGFVFDALTLKRVDLPLENFFIIIHLLIAALGIIFLNLYERKPRLEKVPGRVHFWLIIMLQFAFGGLFSTFLVFYFRSTALSVSWPFLLFLALNLIGNEVFKKKYLRLNFQISIFFVALYSYAIFFVPTLFHELSTRIFIFSGILSLLFISLFLYILNFLTAEKFSQNKKIIIRSILGLYLFINILYFTNIIPPIPLALKDAGVYHSLMPQASGYSVTTEETSWTDYFKLYDTFHHISGEVVYVYSAVFSPTLLDTDIIHDWQYFDKNKNRWVSVNKVSLHIIGGREGGYRLYSLNKYVFAALWRVNVETSRGQVIGRIKFKVEDVATSVTLLSEIK